jgi:hypothetical protein
LRTRHKKHLGRFSIYIDKYLPRARKRQCRQKSEPHKPAPGRTPVKLENEDMTTNAQLKPVPPDVADRILNQGRESEGAWERMRAEWYSENIFWARSAIS